MGFNSGFKGLRSDQKYGYFTSRPTIIYDNMSLYSSKKENYFRQNCRENQNARFFVQHDFFRENRAVNEIMWQYMVQPDRPQVTI